MVSSLARAISRRARAQRVRTEVEKDRLRVRLALRGAQLDSELPVAGALARSSLHACVQLVRRDTAALVVQRELGE